VRKKLDALGNDPAYFNHINPKLCRKYLKVLQSHLVKDRDYKGGIPKDILNEIKWTKLAKYKYTIIRKLARNLSKEEFCNYLMNSSLFKRADLTDHEIEILRGDNLVFTEISSILNTIAYYLASAAGEIDTWVPESKT
jgi:hypothetical protein